MAVKKMELRFGVYHSMYEWFNPLYIQDRNNDFKTQRFVAEKTMPELLELVKITAITCNANNSLQHKAAEGQHSCTRSSSPDSIQSFTLYPFSCNFIIFKSFFVTSSHHVQRRFAFCLTPDGW